MSELKIIEAVRSGDTAVLRTLLAARGNVDERDEQGWTPLCWAAGRGDTETVKLLLEHGADFTLAGRDLRTPRMIARAASREDVVRLLADVEEKTGRRLDPGEAQPYCRAYYLRDMRRFPGWSESRINWQEPVEEGEDWPLTDGDVVYLHQDYTVTKSMWARESLIFDQVTPGWREFCEMQLGFPGSEAADERS